MKRILFVDDEPNILNGLRDSLRCQRREWEMVFAESGADALLEIERAPVDVVVSDMRMPRMDGAMLLQHVMERCPRAVRIVLSGQMEMEAALRSIPIAHQFLGKPCEATHLRSVIQRACDLRELLDDEGLQRRVGGISALPCAPKTFTALTRMIANPEASIRDAALLVESDIAISAKVLQVVNSAFFGLSRRLTNIREAVPYLGINLLRNIVLTVEAFRDLRIGAAPTGLDFDAIQQDSLLTGRIARRLLTDRHEQQDAFTAGSLHEVGLLILAMREPEEYARLGVAARARGVSRAVCERERGGATHAEVGAYLLGLWGLPYGIVEAVAHHHTPARARPTRFGVLEAVACACALAGELNDGDDELNLDMVEQLGLSGSLPLWREIAREERAGLGA